MTDPTDRDREMAEGYYHDADPLYRLDAVPRLAKLLREARAEGRRAAFEEARSASEINLGGGVVRCSLCGMSNIRGRYDENEVIDGVPDHHENCYFRALAAKEQT